MITIVLLFLFSWVVGFSAYGEKLQHEYLAPLSLADFISYQPPRPGRREDGSANFTIMRSRGGPFGQSRETNRTSLVLDALSIGTKYNQLLLEAQQKTWASHRAVRHYFAATELDDADPMCYKTLNRSTIGKIVHLCKKEQPYAKGSMKIQYEEFVKGGFLRKGPGWMCAQQRFAIAWEKIGRLYRHQLEVDKYALPDFLLFQDDDTYYNIPRIQEFLREKDPNVPLAEAPCLLLQSHTHNFSFPWGGFGFILSKGAIDNLIRPIYCNNTEKDDFEEKVCDRLEDDIIGERRYFRDGMSVSDLMGAQVRNNLFSHFSKTDWVYWYVQRCTIFTILLQRKTKECFVFKNNQSSWGLGRWILCQLLLHFVAYR
jgi:hypothetical protein